MLKFISGTEWGADTTTLRITYETIVRPIIEYGFQIYGTASSTCLAELDKIQTGAARVIAGLRNSCPNNIAQFEAGQVPLENRRKCLMNKYINRLRSYDHHHRTAKFINNWTSNQRLKRDSPLFRAKNCEMMFKHDVEYSSPFNTIDPLIDLSNVYFHKTLTEKISKSQDHPLLMKMLGLEFLSSIPPDATRIFTDGSKLDDGSCGSGAIIFQPNTDPITICKRIPNNSSNYRAELEAILSSLKTIGSSKSEIWVMTDSLSALEHLEDYYEIRDGISTEIIMELSRLSRLVPVHLVWIPSHVGIPGNEKADELARGGCNLDVPDGISLTFEEIDSIFKSENKAWEGAPQHHWYRGQRPGEIATFGLCRRDQTALSRFRTGHTKHVKIMAGNKIYPACIYCQSGDMASPGHILECLGVTWKDIHRDPRLLLDNFDIMELI